ncbi:hypothetical protein C7B76_19560 [filamentous cyanobacterium CCP2]|nr:hypothetical protein C7B76_19560 [filamentous cyanobacterium CCP2]
MFLDAVQGLMKAYSRLAPATAQGVIGGSFLDTLWSAAQQERRGYFYTVADQLMAFLVGMADPIPALHLTRSLLEAVNQSNIPDELKSDRRFLHELITLAQAYASVNPADCPADDPQFFLNTLWNGQDEAAIEKGAQELTAFIAGFADPNAMITYARRLIKVAKHYPWTGR